LLPYREPYGWAQLLAFFGARATPGVERVADNRYRRTVQAGDACGVIEVTDVGGSLSLTVHGIPTDALFLVAQRVRGMFDVDAPIDEIARVLRRDRHLRGWLRANPGLRVPGAWDGWELSVRAILGQQVSVRAATTFAGRLAETYGEGVGPAVPAEMPQHLFPTPERLSGARLETIGIVRSRAQCIRDLARAVLAGEVTFDATQSVDEFCRALTAVRGIGNWTAEYVAMRALKDPDAFPASDLGLLRAFDTIAGRRLRPRELEVRAISWRPWRAYAALLTWGSTDGAGG
jgi:AraC family transcriptional regulator of adaptative response / DNA-3-methyladenine glycosylase II